MSVKPDFQICAPVQNHMHVKMQFTSHLSLLSEDVRPSTEFSLEKSSDQTDILEREAMVILFLGEIENMK